MPKIYVSKAFKLLGADGKHTDYPVGAHTVTDAVAKHWFVQHHLGEPSDVSGDVGAAQLAEIEQARAALVAEADRLTIQRNQLDSHANRLDIQAAELKARESAVAEREHAHGSAALEFEAAKKAFAAEKETAAKQAGGAQKQGGKQA